MKNATELFKSSDTSDKQSPGNWIRRKEVKKILDKYDDKLQAAQKDAEGQWLFDDTTFDLYSQYITPKEREMKTEVKQDIQEEWYETFMKRYKKETNEEVYEYLFRKAVEDLLRINFTKLSKMGIINVWDDATPPVKEIVASYLSVCDTRLSKYNKKIDTHLMDSIRMDFSKILDIGEITRKTKTYFSNKDVIIKVNNRFEIVSIKNENG